MAAKAEELMRSFSKLEMARLLLASCDTAALFRAVSMLFMFSRRFSTKLPLKIVAYPQDSHPVQKKGDPESTSSRSRCVSFLLIGFRSKSRNGTIEFGSHPGTSTKSFIAAKSVELLVPVLFCLCKLVRVALDPRRSNSRRFENRAKSRLDVSSSALCNSFILALSLGAAALLPTSENLFRDTGALSMRWAGGTPALLGSDPGGAA
mmetsp:Transcript_23236/g.67071  ORF Transcript_23236/g.67071 Transcript_23236/m.67071 type:complete len:206 (+) Transcript_23236:3088-3705(+)